MFALMTPAWTDNSIITMWRHAHQSWVRVAPTSDDTSVITVVQRLERATDSRVVAGSNTTETAGKLWQFP